MKLSVSEAQRRVNTAPLPVLELSERTQIQLISVTLFCELHGCGYLPFPFPQDLSTTFLLLQLFIFEGLLRDGRATR